MVQAAKTQMHAMGCQSEMGEMDQNKWNANLFKKKKQLLAWQNKITKSCWDLI